MLTILYGSQTGTAEELAFRLGRAATTHGFPHRILPLSDYDPTNLPSPSPTLFLCSTTGEGEEPDSMKSFWRHLRRKDLTRGYLEGMRFAVFGLGDSSYELFNWVGKKLYRRLLQLGGEAVVERGDGDDQHRFGVDGAFVPWMESLWPAFHAIAEAEHWVLEPRSEPLPSFSIQLISDQDETPIHPFDATLVFNKRITVVDDVDVKDVRHIRIATQALYEPGDVAVLRPENSDADVDAILAVLNLAPLAERFVKLESPHLPRHVPRVLTVRRLFKEYLDLNRPPGRYFFEVLSRLVSPTHSLAEAHREKLLELGCDQTDLGLDSHLDYIWRPKRKPVEALADFQSIQAVPLEWILDLFPWIRPRSFSIASYAPGDHVDLAVALVRYRTVMAEERVGLCSRWLEELAPSAQLRLAINAGSMRPVVDPEVPLILLCAGTGIAPMLSILDKIAMAPSKPPVYLFFGCRKRTGDALFIDDLIQKHAWLRVFCVGSRDGVKGVAKVYLPDILRKHADLVADLLLQPRSQWYLSGNSKLPAGVKKALGEIVAARLAVDGPEFVQRLVQSKRFHSETWS